MQLPWRYLHAPVRRPAPTSSLPSATACLLAAQATVLLAQWTWGRGARDPLLAACGVSVAGLRAWHLWQPLTALFVSGGPGTGGWLLPCQWLVFALAGRALETVVGRRHLVQLFVLAGVAGELTQVAAAHWTAHGVDAPVSGGSAASAGIFFALACVLPRAALLPGVTPLRRWQVVHGAAGAALALTILAAAKTPVQALTLGCLAGGLAGCLSMRALGFGLRKPETPPSAAEIIAATELTAPRGPFPTSRFTEREQRMTAREYISEQIDPILEKISRDGIASLTAAERRVLDKGREKISQGT